MCWTVFLCWEWGLSFHILLDPLMQIADSPFLEEKSLIYMNRPRHLVTLTQIISESLKSPQVPHTLLGRIKQAHTIYIQISISYRRTPKYHLVVDLIVMFDYIKKKSYYSYIVSIYHQFIFEILWDYTCLLSCNQLSAQFSACVTKDQGPRSQRRNFQNRRFEKKGRFSKGRGPRRDAANQSRNAGTKGRFQKACEIPMCLKVETFKLNSQGVPRTLYRWRFQLF